MIDDGHRRNRNQSRGESSARHWAKPAAWSLAGLAVLALIALVIIQFVRLQQLRNPAAASSEQSEAVGELVAEVNQRFLLPEEEPTVATVEDAEAIRQQSFFTNAENGDRVLIFPEAQLAVIYRASAGVVVNAGPLVLNAADLAGQQLLEPEQNDQPPEGTE